MTQHPPIFRSALHKRDDNGDYLYGNYSAPMQLARAIAAREGRNIRPRQTLSDVLAHGFDRMSVLDEHSDDL